MMETNQMTKKIIDFQRGAFSSWYGVMTAMQDQVVSSMNTILDQSDWVPDEGRRMVQSWVKACEKGRDDYKGLVEESIDGLEKVLVVKAKKSKVAKQAAEKTQSAAPVKPKEPQTATQQPVSTAPQKPAVSQKPLTKEKPAAVAGTQKKTSK